MWAWRPNPCPDLAPRSLCSCQWMLLHVALRLNRDGHVLPSCSPNALPTSILRDLYASQCTHAPTARTFKGRSYMSSPQQLHPSTIDFQAMHFLKVAVLALFPLIGTVLSAPSRRQSIAGTITSPADGTVIAPGQAFDFQYETMADFGVTSYNVGGSVSNALSLYSFEIASYSSRSGY